MSLDPSALRDLECAIADRMYIQVASWHLYLGDAGLAQALAIECNAYLDEGKSIAAKKALEAVQVDLAGGSISIPLAKLIPQAQIYDLEDLLETYCR